MDSNGDGHTRSYSPFLRNTSHKALAAAALRWFDLKAILTSLVPCMKRLARSASGVPSFLLELIASKPRST